MSQIPEHERGRRDGIRWAVTWLSKRAAAMTDQHGRHILHSAATNLGWALQRTIRGEVSWMTESGGMLPEETEAAERALSETGSGWRECRHEPFEGRCVHCNVPFVDGHPAPHPAETAGPEGDRAREILGEIAAEQGFYEGAASPADTRDAAMIEAQAGKIGRLRTCLGNVADDYFKMARSLLNTDATVPGMPMVEAFGKTARELSENAEFLRAVADGMPREGAEAVALKKLTDDRRDAEARLAEAVALLSDASCWLNLDFAQANDVRDAIDAFLKERLHG